MPLQDGDPARVGQYRLTARLGSGGMGVVYLGVARDGSHVAVKVLRPELADDQEFRARFRREVASLARIDGLCTVRVIEADTESPRPFLVTEYASGPSLAEYVDQAGPLPPEMLYGLAAGLAEALAAIHAASVMHRDLKPSNVLLTPAGPKVIDFGIAQALDATAVTRTGITVGSPGFMAPEQITGHAGQEADIFAWGLTLAYAASGAPPFGTGPSDVILYRIVHDSPDITAVPAELRPLVDAALAREPGSRPTARDLLAQLTPGSAPADNTDGVPTKLVLARTWLLPAASNPEPARRRAWHRPAVIASAVVLAIAAAGVGLALSSAGSGPSGTAEAGDTAPARPAAGKSSGTETTRPPAAPTASRPAAPGSSATTDGPTATGQPSASPTENAALFACKVLQISSGEEFDVTTIGASSYPGTVYVSFAGPPGSGQIFPATTISGATSTPAWHPVPADDIGASAEPYSCAASTE
jgi:serine/threonine protein kinase